MQQVPAHTVPSTRGRACMQPAPAHAVLDRKGDGSAHPVGPEVHDRAGLRSLPLPGRPGVLCVAQRQRGHAQQRLSLWGVPCSLCAGFAAHCRPCVRRCHRCRRRGALPGSLLRGCCMTGRPRAGGGGRGQVRQRELRGGRERVRVARRDPLEARRQRCRQPEPAGLASMLPSFMHAMH